jgi:hypothetical protein
MKKVITLFVFVMLVNVIFGQAKKPTIMVVPSDVWCNTNGYMTNVVVNNETKKTPNYKQAFQENSELILVISKINELMADRGFPLKNMESAIKSVEADAQETKAIKGGVVETDLDRLKKAANADIWIQITWIINEVGPKKSITFNLQGIDAYTDKQIAGASGTGKQSFSTELTVLLEEAVISHLDNFNFQLQNHFNDLFENGREVALRVSLSSSAKFNLESDKFGDDELSVLIENWVNDNTVKNRYSTSQSTENMMLFEQVRIPIYDEKGKALDTRRWVMQLKKHLKDKYNIDSKIVTKGLGYVNLVLDEI